MKKKLKPVPKLPKEAKTAHDLITFLIQIIKEEPQRLFMRWWLTMRNGKMLQTAATKLRWGPLPNGAPDCGTVACAAGWINLLTGHAISNHPTDSRDPGEEALKHLSLNDQKGAGQELNDIFQMASLQPSEVVYRLRSLLDAHGHELREAPIVRKKRTR